MPKCFLSAIAMWESLNFGGPRIAVSVESEDGKPLTNLTQKDFTVGYIGSSGSGAWLEQKITGFESSGSSHGFYMLFIGKYNVGTYSFDWFSYHATSVFSVEVAQGRTKGAFSGRILAINTPTTPTV